MHAWIGLALINSRNKFLVQTKLMSPGKKSLNIFTVQGIHSWNEKRRFNRTVFDSKCASSNNFEGVILCTRHFGGIFPPGAILLSP